MANADEPLIWITRDVALPQAVVAAQSSGTLVLFVGAGASLPAPSSLPLFDGLAFQLAELAKVPYSSGIAIDSFLGSMPGDFDVHGQAKRIITRADSLPNTTHEALVRIASAGGPIRIVTTNFDDHLWSAAEANGVEVSDRWMAPALPLGDDFTGIVYIHGSILRPAKELVLTDGDFGRAYLTRAWATRFLLPMFESFTVLFIGYSHDDPIMKYLALGLLSSTPRYALTQSVQPEDPKWRHIGVKAIEYPVVSGDHGALIAALQAWDRRARMGQLDHQARMKEIVDGGPTVAPVERDYLLERVAGQEGANDFAVAVSTLGESAQLAWLRWAEELDNFRALFTGGSSSDAGDRLGQWFASSFIAKPTLHGAALQSVQRLGQTFNAGLFRVAVWASGQLHQQDEVAGRRWKAFLATSVFGSSAPTALDNLLPYVGSVAEPAVVLRSSLRPYLTLKRKWVIPELYEAVSVPDADPQWLAREEVLTRHIAQLVQAGDPGDPAVGVILEDALLAVYDQLEAYLGDMNFDRFSFGRSAIEPHQQDQFREPVDAIIDGLRDYGDRFLSGRGELSERWWALKYGLFRRLAIHALTGDDSRSADDKIDWVLNRPGVYDMETKHEAYHLLQYALPHAIPVTRARLLEQVMTGPLPDEDPEFERSRAYSVFNLLVWLHDAAPEWQEATAALSAARIEHPDFAPREHPDLDHWMTTGSWGGHAPMELDVFLEGLEAAPSSTVAQLLTIGSTDRGFDEPDWDDVLALVRRAVEARSRAGEQLWALFDSSSLEEVRHIDLRLAIIEGWADAEIGSYSDELIARISAQLGEARAARPIARFLRSQINKRKDEDESAEVRVMRELAGSLWECQAAGYSHPLQDDPTSPAALYLNSWPGDLALFWIDEVERRWRHQREDWSGLNDEESRALSALLEGPVAAQDATGPALGSQLYFLFAADAEFTEERVIPLFSDVATATRMWSAFLYHPRYNDKLLSAGLLDAAVLEWRRLDELGGGLQHQFLGVVASILSLADITPTDRQRLLDASVLTLEGKYATDFAQNVVQFVGLDGIDGAEVWRAWLRGHLSRRFEGVPRAADPEELAGWLNVLPYLGTELGEAIAEFGSRGIGFGRHFVAPSLEGQGIETYGDNLIKHYVDRVINSVPRPGLSYQLQDLIDGLTAVLGKDRVEPLVTAADSVGLLDPFYR